MKAKSTGKVTMSPKLYDEVTTKFISLWGEYAGWAHTVCNFGPFIEASIDLSRLSGVVYC